MDVLRSSVSVLAHFDPDVNAPPTDHAANVRKAERMVAQMATAVAFRERIASGLPVIPPRDDLDHAANFLNMVNGKVPSTTMRDAFDISMVLYTEHELNASTFAARVTVSTLSDIYSGIVAAVGTLKGPLHGGANEEAWKVLERVGSPENAERWIKEALARKERIMGFGHRVYKTGDPRAAILKQYCIELAREVGDDRWERIAEPIERAVTTQKLLPPNVDWPSARLYHYMGLAIDLYTPIFAMARVAGWAAHIIEQLDHNRLMRPRALYVGPPHRPVKPIERPMKLAVARLVERKSKPIANRLQSRASEPGRYLQSGMSITRSRARPRRSARRSLLGSSASSSAFLVCGFLGRRPWAFRRSFRRRALGAALAASLAGLGLGRSVRRGAVRRRMALSSTASARPTTGVFMS